MTFRERGFAVVNGVPSGWLTTYGDVAAAIGHPRSARQVGWALASLLPGRADDVAWWRVINAQGRISFKGETERAQAQADRLAREGLVLDDAGRLPLKQRRWRFEVEQLAQLIRPVD